MTIQEQYNVLCNLAAAIAAEPDSEYKTQKLDYVYNIKKIVELEADNKGINVHE